MNLQNKNIGKIGEDFACKFLQGNGYKILDRNVTSHWSEIDIVAKKGRSLHFVEVKTRTGKKFGKPYEAVGYYKIRSLYRSVNLYLLKNKLKEYKLSLDVISIVLNDNLIIDEIKHYENVPKGVYKI